MATWEDTEPASWDPEFDVCETRDAYVVRGDVPGLAAGDLDVTVTGRCLRITGARECEAPQGRGSYERACGRFARSFELPDAIDADHIRGALVDGVLELRLPKRPHRTIEIAMASGEADEHAIAVPAIDITAPPEMPAPKLA